MLRGGRTILKIMTLREKLNDPKLRDNSCKIHDGVQFGSETCKACPYADFIDSGDLLVCLNEDFVKSHTINTIDIF